MINDYESFIAHLKKTGRLKLLPQILRELAVETARVKKQVFRKETAKDNPSLISGSRTLENWLLTDRSGKRALLDIYQKIVS